MSTFLLGILVGGIIAMVTATLVLTIKNYALTQKTHGMVSLAIMKLANIEKASLATMDASETFVDALRQSANMFVRPPRNDMQGMDNFGDLKRTFEDGIKRYEDGLTDEDDDTEEDEEGPDQPWKKK